MRPILVVVVIVVVAIIAFLGWRSAPPRNDPAPLATPSTGAATETVAAAPATDATTGAAAVADTMEPADAADAAAVASPSFDVVRISPEGKAVIAGRAEPGAEVEITEGGTVIATVTADDRGEWVALPEQPIAPGNRQLALTQRTIEGVTVESDTVVVLAVPERADDGGPADQGALALLMPRDEGGGVKILQEPTGGIGLKGPEGLSLDTIEYDDEGAFALGGRATPDSRIKAYIDNAFIGEATTDENRNWRITPDAPTTPGLHKLRIDQTDAVGKVVARLETPFARADFLLPSEATALVVVQPGNSLWRIARRRYGLGPQYVQIFEANRDQISNPDLIYPGQIFELPQVN
jgi:nucleoid-associated protein YgaU